MSLLNNLIMDFSVVGVISFYWKRGQIDTSEKKGVTGSSSSHHFRLASNLIHQWAGTGFIGPWWDTPSPQMASPAKNFPVAAPHAVGSLVKSAAATGVTKNLSRLFQHQGMFHCHCLNSALVWVLRNMKSWFTDWWQWMSYFYIGIVYQPRTPCEHGMACLAIRKIIWA